jgi:serine/threonine protein kinase
MNPNCNSFIIKYQNAMKDLSIPQKLKSIRLKMAYYRADYNKAINKTDILCPLNSTQYNKKNSITNSINSINNSSNSISKYLIENKKKKTNNKSYDISNNNTIIINRIIDKKKCGKLKNKTPDMSRISTATNKKMIGHNSLNKNKNKKNEIFKDYNDNKKYNKIKISYENFLNKKQEIKNNNSIEWKKLNINTFNNYIKKSKEKNCYHQRKIKDFSNLKKLSIIKYYPVTPLNVSINNKRQNNSIISINHSTNDNTTKIKINKNINFKENKKNKIKNGYSGYRNSINKNFPTSINNSIIIDDKFNIKIKNNIYNAYNNNIITYDKKEYNKKLKQILCKSQHEIEKIRNDFVVHFTSKNSPKKNGFIKKINKNIITNNNKNNKNNKSFQINKNFLKLKNNNKKILNLSNKKNKINEKNKIKINNDKTKEKEKIKELKNNLLKSNNSKKTKINNNNNVNNNIIIEDNLQNQNYYLDESIKLSNYIKKYYKENKVYPKTNLNFYKYGRLIGQGAFGKVNIGLNVLTGRIVAIKSIDKNKLDNKNENMRKILYECNLMKKLNHPNITKILEMFDDEKFFLIIMEYINGGNLFSFVKKRRKLSEKIAKFLFRQIILGIQHMHSKNIIHRDIKLENILIDLNNNIKICDFGISLILDSMTDVLYEHCGTPMYIAPEILLSNESQGYLGPPIDIWSAGIALYIMLSGNIPFNITEISNGIHDEVKSKDIKKNNILLQYSILTKQPTKIEGISDSAQDLLKGILNKDPKKRLTIEQILNHPWLYYDDNYKHHLFTKTEMIILSRTFVDYRYSKTKDLLENFTLSNLKNDNKNNDKNTEQNIFTKSSILAPYNSLNNEDNSSFNENQINNYDDKINNEINFENSYIVFSNKARELNMIYELNNNEEIDNGILINSKTNSSNKLNISKEMNLSDNKKMKEKQKTENILDKIEKLGYNREYAFKIIRKNELSHVYAIYFLLKNYDKI